MSIRRLIRPVGRAALCAATIDLVCALLIIVFSSAHLVAVTARRIDLKIPAWAPGEPHAMLGNVPYDFRIYSLVLFGAVILAGGLTALRASVGIARGQEDARRRASNAFLMVLAVVVPVMPMQDAAPILIVPAAAGFIAAACAGISLPRYFASPASSRVNTCSVTQ